MLHFRHEDKAFNYRVAGVAICGDRILIHRAEGEDFWTLPGGRCEWMEASSDALAREMHEELGTSVVVGPLIWLVENFFQYQGRSFHELGFYFKMTLPDDSPFHGFTGQKDAWDEDTRLIFEWHRIDELAALPLYPEFLREALFTLPVGPAHVVIRG